MSGLKASPLAQENLPHTHPGLSYSLPMTQLYFLPPPPYPQGTQTLFPDPHLGADVTFKPIPASVRVPARGKAGTGWEARMGWLRSHSWAFQASGGPFPCLQPHPQSAVASHTRTPSVTPRPSPIFTSQLPIKLHFNYQHCPPPSHKPLPPLVSPLAPRPAGSWFSRIFIEFAPHHAHA